MISISDSLGFAILGLSLNETKPVKWETIEKKTQVLFLKAMNKGIDKTQADIRRKDELYTFYYNDEFSDFKAFYVILKGEVVFSFEE